MGRHSAEFCGVPFSALYAACVPLSGYCRGICPGSHAHGTAPHFCSLVCTFFYPFRSFLRGIPNRFAASTTHSSGLFVLSASLILKASSATAHCSPLIFETRSIASCRKLFELCSIYDFLLVFSVGDRYNRNTGLPVVVGGQALCVVLWSARTQGAFLFSICVSVKVNVSTPLGDGAEIAPLSHIMGGVAPPTSLYFLFIVYVYSLGFKVCIRLEYQWYTTGITLCASAD